MCTFIEMDDKVASEYLNGTDDEDQRESTISKQISKLLTDVINKDKHGLVEVLLKWNICHSKRLLPLMDNICSEMTKGVLKSSFLDIINKITSPDQNLIPLRDTLVDVGLLLSAYISAADLADKEYASFLDKMKSRYIPAMTDFQNSNYDNWHKIWMFLVKFCGKKLHQSTDLTNNLLRIVENAFRNSSNEQRLKGYDCWKEFIDNASLDKDYLCKSKQITLLVTPLRAKFSKQESIIYKRFEVFVYLLETLQDRAVLCLKPFLEVVFGTSDSSKLGLAKSVKQIAPKSIEVLIGILGHGHGDDFECVNVDVCFDRPIINETNFKDFYESLVNSVIQSCSLLNLENMKNQKEKAMPCLWKSLFNHIISSPMTDKKLCFSLIRDHLNALLEQKENPLNQELLKIIFKTAMSLSSFDMDSALLKQFLVIFITLDVGSLQDEFCEYILQGALNDFSEENETFVYQNIVTCLVTTEMDDIIIPNYEKIWLHLMNALTINQHLITSKITNFYECFMWPLSNLHIFQETERKQIIVCWIKQFNKLTSNNESKKISIINDIKHRLEKNPSLTLNGLFLLNEISQCETKFSADFVTNLMTAVSLVLQSGAKLTNENEIKICHLVMQYLDPSLNCYKDKNELVVKSVSSCVKCLLALPNGIKIIDELLKFLKNCSNALNSTFSTHLKQFLINMHKETTKNNDLKSQINKIIAAFNENDSKRTFIVPTKRSARMTCMVKNVTDNTFQLFGKDSEKSDSDTELKKPLKASKKIKASKISSVPKPLTEENSEDFVLINTEVKLQPDKLNEHQKEVLKTRRPDIPALYEDLSQSVSQDLFNFTSKEKCTPKNEICQPEAKEKDVPNSIDLFSQESNNTNKIDSISTNDLNKSVSDDTNKQIKPTVDDANTPLSNDVNESPSVDSSKLPSNHGNNQTFDDLANPLHRDSPKTSREIKRLNLSIVGVDQYFGHESRTRTKKPTKKAEENKSLQKPKVPRKQGRPPKYPRVQNLANINSERQSRESPIFNGESNASNPTESASKSLDFEENKPVKLDLKESNLSPYFGPITSANTKNAGDGKTLVRKKPQRRAKSLPSGGVLKSIGQTNFKVHSLDNRKKNRHKSRLSSNDNMIVFEQGNCAKPNSSEKKKRGRPKLENFKIDNQNVEENIKMTFRRVSSPKTSLTDLAEKTHKKKKLEKIISNISAESIEKIESHTEDVIESSQDSFVKTLSTSKPGLTEEKEITSQDTTLTQESSVESEINTGQSSPKPPEKSSLTESELFTSHMDTMSICESETNATQSTIIQESASLTPSLPYIPHKLTIFLPSSPVHFDTPTRNNEFVSSTVDISPISSKNCSVDDFKETPKNAILNETASSDGKNTELPMTELLNDHAKDNNNTLEGDSLDSKLIHEQFEKFISESMAIKKLPQINLKFGTISSPSLRTLKSTGNSKQSEPYTESDILRFSREIPSPYAVPKSSILKRKMCDTADNEGYSPCPKRKRVNFSDPCLTSKKIIINDDQQQAKRLFDSSEEISGVRPLNGSTSSESSEASADTSVQKSKPIYPKLVDCTDDVYAIIKRVTSPLFLQASMNKLKEMNVKTVGDLARLSEAEVSGLPLKVPVVANLLAALENHWKKTSSKIECETVPQSKNDDKMDGKNDSKNDGKIDDARVPVLEEKTSEVSDTRVLPSVEASEDPSTYLDSTKAFLEKFLKDGIESSKADRIKTVAKYVQDCHSILIDFICNIEEGNA